MKVFVKVCGLTHPDDVAAAVEAGADALGFVFAASKRRVTPERAARLCEAVPPSVLKVAVMLHPSDEDWQTVFAAVTPDVLQTDAEDFTALTVDERIRRWPVCRQQPGSVPVKQIGYESALPAEAYVYEGGRSGQGQTVDWREAARVARRGRMILAGGLGPDNVAEAVRAVRPWGVDASSGLEAEPGRKDAARVAAYIRNARSALD